MLLSQKTYGGIIKNKIMTVKKLARRRRNEGRNLLTSERTLHYDNIPYMTNMANFVPAATEPNSSSIKK